MQRDLVQRAQTGDREAFSELIRMSFSRLHGIATLILGDRDRAEDATQDALVAAWRDLRGLRDPDRFDAWLRRLLVRTCYREARRDRALRRLEVNVDPLPGVVPDGSDIVGDRDELQRGFSHLDADQRALLVLHFYLQLPVQETAEALGIPVGTVKSRVSRTTALLRASLEAEARTSSPVEGGRA
jgi:RNA polymerase sigma factor (sigma-70 family)